MLQINTNVRASANGSRNTVVGSGMTNMSLSWISWKPRIEEPSKPTASARLSRSRALGGTEKCCHRPGRSVNQIDHLDLVILDRLQDILGTGAGVSHGCLLSCECGSVEAAVERVELRFCCAWHQGQEHGNLIIFSVLQRVERSTGPRWSSHRRYDRSGKC